MAKLRLLTVTGILLAAMPLLAQGLRLADVRKVYIEKMANNLDEYLRSSISRQFHSRVTVVLDATQADAILSGDNLTAQQTRNATVSLTDPKSRTVLWSGTAGDRSKAFLNVKHGGEQKLADNLIGQLRKAMER